MTQPFEDMEIELSEIVRALARRAASELREQEVSSTLDDSDALSKYI